MRCKCLRSGGGRGIRTPKGLAARWISSPLPYQLRLALRVRDKRHLRYIKHRPDPQEQHALLDHLICQQQDRLRDREPQSLGGLAVADQLEGGGLPDGQIGRLRAPQDAIHVRRRLPV